MKHTMTRRTLLANALALGTTLATTSCGGNKAGTSAEPNPDTITVGITTDIDSMDPAKVESAATRELHFNVFDGLVKPDTEGNLLPALASSWTISPDGSVYSFTLREGVKFHDDTPVTTDDVKYSIERYRDSTSGGSLVAAFAAVDHVDVVDSTHVDVTLAEPNTDFLAYFMVGITPAHVDNLETNPVGAGPYKFSSRSPLENVTLAKFDDYWDAENAASINNVIFKITSNTDAISMELAGGSIDMFYRLPEAQVDQLASDQFDLYEGTMNIVQALYVNNAKAPFDDVRVRQALAYAIDKQQIMDYVSGGKGEKVGSSMYPAFGKYFLPELNDAYSQNLDKARELLAEAGYENGFSFTIAVSSDHAQHVETSEVIKEQLAAIGVTANIQELEWNSWLSGVYSDRNFEATVIGLDAAALNAPGMLSRFVSTANNNFVNFSSPTYDETYAKAFASVDDAEKTELYKECERILSQECAAVYIQDLPSFVALRKCFSGYEFYPLYAQNIATIRFVG